MYSEVCTVVTLVNTFAIGVAAVIVGIATIKHSKKGTELHLTYEWIVDWFDSLKAARPGFMAKYGAVINEDFRLVMNGNNNWKHAKAAETFIEKWTGLVAMTPWEATETQD